jgi:hypothetical protein
VFEASNIPRSCKRQRENQEETEEPSRVITGNVGVLTTGQLLSFHIRTFAG